MMFYYMDLRINQPIMVQCGNRKHEWNFNFSFHAFPLLPFCFFIRILLLSFSLLAFLFTPSLLRSFL